MKLPSRVEEEPQALTEDHSSYAATVQDDRPWRKRGLRQLVVNRGVSEKRHLSRVRGQVRSLRRKKKG